MKPHIFVLLAVLVVGVCLVSPVSAYTITAEPLGGEAHLTQGKTTDMVVDMSPEGEAVQRIVVDVPTGTSVNFTLWYGSGKTVTGWMQYNPSTSCDDFVSWFDSFCQYSGVAIGTDIQGYNYRGVEEIGRLDIVGYGRNETSNETGFLVYDTVAGVWQGQIMAFFSVSDPRDMVIYKFQVTSNNPVDVSYYTNTRENVLKAATKTLFETGGDWIAFAIAFSTAVLSFVILVKDVLIFFFIDFLWLTIALYFGITMAVSFGNSKDIWQAFHKFFKYQKAIFKFMTETWNELVGIIASFRGIFRI